MLHTVSAYTHLYYSNNTPNSVTTWPWRTAWHQNSDPIYAQNLCHCSNKSQGHNKSLQIILIFIYQFHHYHIYQ